MPSPAATGVCTEPKPTFLTDTAKGVPHLELDEFINPGRKDSGAIIKDAITQAFRRENEMMREYLIMAEKLDSDGLPELKKRLHEFAEGNAKRSLQLEQIFAKLGTSKA